jgi:signal transduction histidine kinase
MLMRIQEQNRQQRTDQEIKKKGIVLRKASIRPMANFTQEQKQDHKILQLSKKIDDLTNLIQEQTKIIHDLRNEVKTSLGKPNVRLKKLKNNKRSSHDFSSEYSNSSSFRQKHLKRPTINEPSVLEQFSSPKVSFLP